MMLQSTLMKNKTTKKSVYFIATKYKNNPVKIDFYTSSGEPVPPEKVEKKQTNAGTQLFTAVGK